MKRERNNPPFAVVAAAGLACLFASARSAPAVSVRDFGAVGDGKTDDTNAFVKALEESDGDLFVPPGRYVVAEVNVPDATFVHGAGARSVIVLLPDKDYALTPGANCRLTDLTFTVLDREKDRTSAVTTGLIRIGQVEGVTLTRLTFQNAMRGGVVTDHATRFRVTHCNFRNLGVGVSIQFSQRGIITDNVVEDIGQHGIQFWGNWKFELMDCKDLVFARNIVRNVAGGGIWGTGGVRIVMNDNVVDGAGDICLDYEWCRDSTIVGNTVRNGNNAGISLFFSCHNVNISGNTVVITDGKVGRRDGIWLTGTNKLKFKGDTGHRTVAIVGNAIRAEGKDKRHGIFIGSGSNIHAADNVLENVDIVDRTGRNVRVEGNERLRETTTVQPLSQKWKFKTDPKDEGTAGKWFAPDLDDKEWAAVRSDREGEGWESQGFEGYEGYAWYRATLPAPPARRRTFVYLHFGAVDEQAWVYLGGKLAFEHTEKSTGRSYTAIWDEPFSANVTAHLRPDAPNQLAVRVHNKALHGGLRRPVHLIWSDAPLERDEQELAIAVAAAARKK